MTPYRPRKAGVAAREMKYTPTTVIAGTALSTETVCIAPRYATSPAPPRILNCVAKYTMNNTKLWTRYTM